MREYAAPLSYAAAALYLVHFLLGFAPGSAAAGAGVGILFALLLPLLVRCVDASPAARLAGYGWASLGLVASTVLLAAGPGVAAATLAALAILAGAAWVADASLHDPGAGRPLGIAAATGMGLSATLGLAQAYLASDSILIVRLAAQLSLALLVVWFVVLGRDLAREEARWAAPSGPHAGPGAPRG